MSNPHKDAAGWGAHLATTLGTASEDSLTQAVHRIGIAVADRGKTSTETQVNAALALMGAVAPRDELEAAIGEQIVAAHTASLDFLHRARSNAGEFVATANIYAGMATKLSRTMGSLVETLAKLRSGGRQRIEVVYVNGPAIIGDHAQAVISTGGPGGGGNTKGDQPHAIDQLASLAYAPGLPMRRQDPDGEPLPSPGGAGSETLSDARRQ